MNINEIKYDKYTEVVFDDIIFGNPIYNEITRNYNSLTNIAFLASGMKLLTIEKIGDIDYTELEFIDNNLSFYNFIYNLDDYILEYIILHGKKWWGQQPSIDHISELFEKSIKNPIPPDNNINRFPSMKFQISETCKIFGLNSKLIGINELLKNNEVVCKIMIDSIVFYENRFNLNFTVNEIRVVSPLCQYKECLFSDSE
jgi:hypothetical protein